MSDDLTQLDADGPGYGGYEGYHLPCGDPDCTLTTTLSTVISTGECICGREIDVYVSR